MKSNSLFWEFSTTDSPEPSVLCGTIHLGTEECMAHWDRIEDFINRFDDIYTESSLDTEDFKYLQPFTLLPAGIRWQDHVSVRRWAKMRTVFLKYCKVNIDHLGMLRPLFILAQVQGQLIAPQAMLPLDQKIWDTALAAGKSASGVESPQEQVRILQALDISQQYKQLVRMSKNITTTRTKLKKLLNAYRDQNISRLYKMSKGSLGGDRTTLIRDRNQVMATRLIDMHHRSPSFFSFGAGHLAGGTGVLRLLKHAGAVVRSI